MMGFFEPNKLEKNNKAVLNKSLIAIIALTLTSCGAPERLSQDVDVESSKSLVKERIIAPLSGDNETAAILPELEPRRQLLQLRYNDDSLINPEFIDTLERLSSVYTGDSQRFEQAALPASLTATAVSFTEDPFQEMKEQLEEVEPEPEPQYEPVSEEERDRINRIRSSKRRDIIMREGLELEKDLFEKLRAIDEAFETTGQELENTLFTQLAATTTRIEELETNRIPGVGENPPGEIFGRNLLRDEKGYLSIPSDLTLMGNSEEGAVSSKIGVLRAQVSNPEVRISFAGLPLPDAIRFIANTIDLQVLMSTEVEESPDLVTINIQAGALSILDALLSQYDISILYDKDLEVAQIYTDAEFQGRITVVRQAIESYNNTLFERRELARLKQEQILLNELIDVARAIIYDYETDTASGYSQDEVDRLITRIPQNEDTFSKPLAEKRALEAIQRDKDRLMDMIYMVQTLLSGESEKFFNAVDLMPRDPGGEVVTTTLSELTLKRLTMAEVLEKFDEETARALEDRLVVVAPQPKKKTASKKPAKPKNRIPINTIPGFGNLAVEDPCIYDGREVFTEKVAVYGGENSISRIEGILSGYFDANASAFEVVNEEDEEESETQEGAAQEEAPQATSEAPASEAEGADAGEETQSSLSELDISASDLIPEVKIPEIIKDEEEDEPIRPVGCGETDPASESPNYVAAADFSGFVVSGLISDIELFVRLVEEFDRPQRQVLIEVFMINVVKDFNRRLDLSFQTDALAENLDDTGGFFLRRDLTALSNNITSTNPGGFVSGLISPNLQVQALVDFIETNDLGRTISSPTILVEEGSSASVTRTNTKPVTRVTSSTVLDSNGNSVAVPTSVTETATVSFSLNVSDVNINPNNNNVSLTFGLTDQSFETTLANVTSETGTISDEISTQFVAAPGDVIVLAGLFKQSDSAEATGLPGTTTSGLPTAFLLGGEDSVGNKVEEMVILMAPTVIEPEIGTPQPNSALNRTIGAPVSLGNGG